MWKVLNLVWKLRPVHLVNIWYFALVYLFILPLAHVSTCCFPSVLDGHLSLRTNRILLNIWIVHVAPMFVLDSYLSMWSWFLYTFLIPSFELLSTFIVQQNLDTELEKIPIFFTSWISHNMLPIVDYYDRNIMFMQLMC